MSIPPLVCSTPPPLEQVECEDDTGHDEFAVQYDLSQEDDDFCPYEDYQIKVPASLDHNKQNEKVAQNEFSSDPPYLQDPVVSEPVNAECEKECGNISKTAIIDEDNNIEDLDLKFEPLSIKSSAREDSSNDEEKSLTKSKSQEINITSVEDIAEIGATVDCETDYCDSQCSISTSEVLMTENVTIENNDSPSKDIQDSKTHTNILHVESIEIETLQDITMETEVDFNDFQTIPTEQTLEKEVFGGFRIDQTSDFPQDKEKEDINALTDDDFNDFNTFHINKQTHVDNDGIIGDIEHDPWNSDSTPVDNFGDFQATFDDNLAPTQGPTDRIDDTLAGTAPIVIEQDDDFGDFDDYKSESVTVPGSVEVDTRPGLNTGAFEFINTDNENQIYASIEKSIHSLYVDDISDKTERIERSLESHLCETWGYLTETEIRQPYMVNWNNSIAQKTLLKSLCIDSRNILFGPKWNNMPRYAANLGAAPLQPLKPIPATATATLTLSAGEHQGTTQGDKPAAMRSVDTWAESVANEGQEFTYAEALLLDLEHLMATLDQMAHNQSSLKISELLSHACNDTDNISDTPTQHSEPESKKSDERASSKTFPSTLTLQPLRQIPLPDTHIFTPTDSELPRSKTIHYDQISPVTQHITRDNLSNVCGSLHLDNEYDDFQDFQDTTSQQLPETKLSTVDSQMIVTNRSLDNLPNKDLKPELKGDITYQTQTILEPIKLEPSMPQLNWPEPGEVKETFDDFSDFVSNSSWSSVNQTDAQKVNDHHNDLPPLQSKIPLGHLDVAPELVSDVKAIEDDFDNFQFASTESVKSGGEMFPSNNTPFPQPIAPVNHPINGLLNPMASQTIPPPLIPKASTSFQILQPSPVDQLNNSSQDKVNTQQILQPLSLESFSQINWPSPGVDLQDLSRFNPIHAVHSLHQSPSGGKASSPAHSLRSQPQQPEDDGWGDFVSIKPNKSPGRTFTPKPSTDDDDWSDFVSSANSKPLNGVNTISFNVHTNFSAQKGSAPSRAPSDGSRVDVPSLNYITPKTNHKSVRDSHFQNL